MSDVLTILSSYGPRAGSTRVRTLDWAAWLGLQTEDHFFTHASSNSLRKLAGSPGSVIRSQRALTDMVPTVAEQSVLVSRRATPIGSGRVESRLLMAAGHGVYDFDDAVFMPTRFPKKLVFDAPSAWRRMVQAADTVIAGNDYLADRATDFSDSVVMIPSCVDPGRYLRRTDFRGGTARTAVWIGSPSTERYLAEIREPLLRAHQQHGLKLLVISGPGGNLGPLEAMVERVPWQPDTFAAHLSRADFGLMPLPDSQWTRGKCAYKLLQYGATGLPMIGSPVGANTAVLTGCDGLAPESEDEWSSALDQVLGEPTERLAARGAAASRFVSDNYSFEAWADTWVGAVLSASA